MDTGAGKTGIAQHTAEQLGLTEVGTCNSFGAHGAQESKRYRANFTLGIGNALGRVLSLVFEDHEVMGIPKMKESFDQFGIRDQSGNLINVIGVLGREFLRHTELHYSGPTGRIDLEIDIASIQNAQLIGAPVVPKLSIV